MPCLASSVELHIQQVPGDHPPLTGAGETGVLHGVVEVEQHARLIAGVALVHQYCATAQEIAMTLQSEVDDGIEQRVAGADEGGERLALGCDQRLVEDDAFVAR